MFDEIKWAYQRVVRGYDDRVRWGFDSYFLQVMPALREFCVDYINGDSAHLNSYRTKVFKNTIKLIDDYTNDVDSWSMTEELSSVKLLTYVGKHSGYYWD